jgi:Dolichyl-phosphate-mannose-protein mannosyltransferase
LNVVRRELYASPQDTAAGLAPLVLVGRAVIAIVVLLLALSLHRAFVTNINWDEFFYLSKVHLYLNGLLSNRLQTFGVHFFGWLPLVSDDEIQQIVAARVFLWLLSLVTNWLIYKIARRFCSKEAALLSVLFYLGFSFVVDHGLSFRSDPLCADLFLASLFFLLGRDNSRYHLAISAFLLAVAIMVSIKSMFYLGTIGTIFLGLFVVNSNRRVIAMDAFYFAVAVSISFLVLYHAHGSALAKHDLFDPSAFIGNAGAKMLLSTPFLPRFDTIRNALFQNGPIWVLICLGLAKVGYDLITANGRRNAVILLSFAVPLLSLLIYRNAYPYFFVFLMPAVVILGGVFADVLIARHRASGSKILPLILAGTVLVTVGGVLGDYVRKLPDQMAAQSEIVELVHRMFPEPVPYIDRNSMISSYPKVGFFMSTWGMENYLTRNVPVMDDLIRREQPRFLIANACSLDISRPMADEHAQCQYRLLSEDFETLQANFVHHWGAVYVAGKAIDLRVPREPQEFEILISGLYTVEAETAVIIDGETLEPGEQVRLDQAVHNIAATDTPERAVLRFGKNLFKPDHAPSSQPIYYGF